MCKRIIRLMLSLLLCWGLSANSISSTVGLGPSESMAAPLPAWPHETSDLPADPALIFGRLDNGFRYVLMENHNPKDRVSMHLNVQAGSANESESQQGLAHFLEHMLFNGSEHFEPGELIKYFQSIGMQFGPDANAHTGFFETVYDLLLPDGKEDSLRKGLLVLQDYAQGALLLESEIERERKVILAEKRQRDSASYRTFVSGIKFELPDTLIAKRLPIGQEQIIQQATRNDLKSYYDTWYRPETMVLVAVGGFDAGMAQALIQEYFESLVPRTPEAPDQDFGSVTHRGVKAFHHYEAETGNTTVTIEVLSKVPLQKDRLKLRQQRLLEQIAHEMMQNRLDLRISTRQAPGTSAGIGTGLFAKQIAYAMITAEGPPDEWQTRLKFLEKELRQALVFGFTPSELERVKKDIISNLEQADSKKATRDSKALARQIIRSINTDRVIVSPEDKMNLLVPYVTSLTIEDANRAFRKTWAFQHRLILVSGNANLKQNHQDVELAIKRIYQNSTEEDVFPPPVKQANLFPYLPEPLKTGTIVNKTVHEDLGIIQIDYQNGFRLNLKKTDFKDDEILATLGFGNGRFSEPLEFPGLAELSTSVINESGFGSLNRADLESALAGKQSKTVFGVGENMFMLNGETIPEELPLLFQLLYTQIKDPGFREEAFDLVMSQFDDRYKELMHTVDGIMTIEGRRFLAGGDTRFGLPSHDRFKELRLSDVKNWMGQILSGSIYELSVVGDIDVDDVIALAGRYFGTFPAPSSSLSGRRGGPVFPAGEKLELEVDTKIPNGLVYVAYATDDIRDIHKTRRMNLLADVFSERMRIQIREKLGEAYSPFAFNRPSRIYNGYGVFNAVVEVNPDRAQLVIDEIHKIAKALSEGGISQDEVARSLGPTLNSIKDMRQRNTYWLNTVLTGSKQRPQKIEWSRSIEKDYAAITPEDLELLSRQYLINDESASIVATPAISN